MFNGITVISISILATNFPFVLEVVEGPFRQRYHTRYVCKMFVVFLKFFLSGINRMLEICGGARLMNGQIDGWTDMTHLNENYVTFFF